MNEFVDYAMAANVVTIGLCLLLSAVWLAIGVSRSIITLGRSACACARSLVLRELPAKTFPPARDMSAGNVTASQSISSPTGSTSPTTTASPAGEGIAFFTGEDTAGVGEGSPTPLPTTKGVAKGRRAVVSDPTDCSVEPCRQSAEAFGSGWRPLATRRQPSAPASTIPLPVPAIPEAEAAMRFRIWLLQSGLEQIGRAHGDLIATVDIWDLAQRFAQERGFRIDSHDRFFEALRKLPGVDKETDRWVTRLRGSRQKRVAYSFRPAINEVRASVVGL